SLRTLAIATLVLEDGIFTVGLPTAAAFLMRTSMSAMGSVMLMEVPYERTDIRFREIRRVVPRLATGAVGGPPGGPGRTGKPTIIYEPGHARGGLALPRPGPEDRLTSWPCAGPARHRAWWPGAACSGPARTSRRPRAGGRSGRSGWSAGPARSRAAASAAWSRPRAFPRSSPSGWR